MRNLLFFIIASYVFILFSCANPVAKFTYSGNERTAPVEIKFENISENADVFLWDFDDETTIKTKSPYHKYTSSGNYRVKLTAKKGEKESVFEETIQINPPENCLVEIVTDLGTMTIELFDETPLHRDNFIKLVEDGFYNELLFHRVINGFMIQGGDPDSKNAKPNQSLGSGGPDYTIPAELNSSFVHLKGALAAARTGDDVNPEKESSGSQFYIVHGGKVSEQELDQIEAKNGFFYSKKQKEEYKRLGGTPFLDMNYTVFGRVIDGLDVIDKIAEVKTDKNNRPLDNIQMKIIAIK